MTLGPGRARFKHFPGASSKDLLHYIDATLEEQNFEAAIIHIGINDILYDNTSQQINLLLQNIKEIGKKCKSYKFKYVFISSLTFNTRISHRLLSEINEMIERVFLGNGYYYTENENVYENDLFKDGLHLQNSGKKTFIVNLQTYGTCFRKTNMVPKYRSTREFGVASATGKSDLQMLHDLRFEYPKSLLCGYLNINNLRNKIRDLRLIIHDVPLDYFVISKLNSTIAFQMRS